MVEMATNPWVKEHSTLPQDKPSSNDILRDIAIILEEWPGPSITSLSPKQRLDMFVRVIAGYPNIGQGLRPLDHPLHARSQRALSLSLNLDSIQGLNPYSSLRSDILDLNIAWDHTSENKLIYSLLLLINSLFEEDLEGVKTNPTVIRLCGLLFTFDNTGWDKFTELFGENGSLYDMGGSMTDARIRMKLEIELREKFGLHMVSGVRWDDKRIKAHLGPKMSDIKNEAVDPKNIYEEAFNDTEDPPDEETFFTWVKLQRKIYNNSLGKGKLKHFTHDLSNSLFLRNSSGLGDGRIVFEYRFIQDWLQNLYFNRDNDIGTGQRYLRGGSALIEASLSSIRQFVCEELGPGCIEIDGGGRIELRLNKKDKHKTEIGVEINFLDDTIRDINKRFIEMFNLGKESGDLSERFEHELETWHISQIPNIENIDHPGGEKKELNEEFVKAGMPPRSVYIVEDNYSNEEESLSLSSLNHERRIQSMAKQKIRLGQNDCPRCKSYESIEERNWTKEQSWYIEDCCPFHILVFEIGLSQRKRDSIISLPSSDEVDSSEVRTSNKVTQIARLDGNSVGWIFTRDGLDQSPDNRRRRCFRYNAHWWISLARSFDGVKAIDSVGAWITGGDDILLAQYGEGPHLVDMMEDVCKNLDNSLNVEMAAEPNGPLCTVTIGHVKNKNIREMLAASLQLEYDAKKAWKIKAGQNSREMISPEKIPPNADAFDDDFIDSLVDPEIKHLIVSKESSDINIGENLDNSDPIVVNWSGEWSLELIENILENANDLGGTWHHLIDSKETDPEKFYRILQRSYIIYSDDEEQQLKILPPKAE